MAMAAGCLLAPVALSGCGSPSTTVGQQVRAWAQSSGWEGSVSQLRGDLDRVPGLSAQGPGARRTVCDVLVTDALAANQQLPTPDRTLTQLLSEAYGAAANAGRECFSGSVPLSRATAGAAAAATMLVRAQARFDSLTSSLAGAS
jgi:hypothetical protein